MSQNSRKKRVLWRNNEIDLLLIVWEEYADDLRRVKRTAKIYEFISQKLNENNIEKSSIEVSFKIGNMTKKFRRIERNMRVKSGGCSDWPYFERVKRIIGQYPYNDDPLMQETSNHMDYNDMSLQSSMTYTEGSSTLAMSTPRKGTFSETASEDSESFEILSIRNNSTPGRDRSSVPLLSSVDVLPSTSTSAVRKRKNNSWAEKLLQEGGKSNQAIREEDAKDENTFLKKKGSEAIQLCEAIDDYCRRSCKNHDNCSQPQSTMNKFKHHKDILFLEKLMASRQTNVEAHNGTQSAISLKNCLQQKKKQNDTKYHKKICRNKNQENEFKRKRIQNELMKLRKDAYNIIKVKKAVAKSKNEINRPTNPGLYNFFISLYETSVNFPPHIQCQIKRKFFNIISDYEEQLIAPATSATSYTISSLSSTSNGSQSIDKDFVSTSSFQEHPEEILLPDINKNIKENDIKPDLQSLILT